ncbi:MAG: 50S ribosomal protein L30e [Candidatus Thermoplasmatota archaeon]|nr:50S ribosomal protein L30e [Candidatus Thermoplasmatota archaeon]
MVEVEKSFKNIVKKGTVIFGKRQTELSIAEKKAKLVVLATNCPFTEEIQQHAQKHDVPVYISTATSVELGAICGKAFPVASFSILQDGGTNILSLINQR